MAEETDIKKMKGESIEYLLKFCISQLVLQGIIKLWCIVQYFKYKATTELYILFANYSCTIFLHNMSLDICLLNNKYQHIKKICILLY